MHMGVLQACRPIIVSMCAMRNDLKLLRSKLSKHAKCRSCNINSVGCACQSSFGFDGHWVVIKGSDGLWVGIVV